MFYESNYIIWQCRIFKLLLVALIGSAYAGQSLEQYTNKKQVKNTGYPIAIEFLDDNKRFMSVSTPLRIESQQENLFYLHAYRVDGAVHESFIADLEIEDMDFTPQTDIAFLLPEDKQCVFVQNDEAGFFCPVRLKDKDAPLYGEYRQFFYSSLQEYFTADSKNIIVYPHSDGGRIDGVGPDNHADNLTAIAVSDSPLQDNVPLKLEVHGSKNLQKIHLEVEVESAEIADFAGVKKSSCDITVFNPDGSGVCGTMIPVTPYQIGKTKVHFLPDSYWMAISDPTKHYYSDLTQIKVNVGTLFAGYPHGRAYRRGSTQIIPAAMNESISSVAVDEPSHKLYAMAAESVYRQNNVTEDELKLGWLVDLPPASGIGKTLGLTDVTNRILIATDNGNIYEVTDKAPGPWIDLRSRLYTSVDSSYIDKITNIVYFGNELTSFGIYYSRYGSGCEDISSPKCSSKFSAWESILPKDKYQNLLIAADNNIVYASVRNMAESGSRLFSWIDENMTPVQISGYDPFEAHEISLLMFSKGKLYAGSDTGQLYYLTKHTMTWQLVGNTEGRIIDSAVDFNGNIYLANGSDGLWKIPFDILENPEHKPYKILNYSQEDDQGQSLTINTIAIDNNL